RPGIDRARDGADAMTDTNPHTVTARICDQHGLPIEVLRSKKRNRRTMIVRRAVARELRQMGLSLSDIGDDSSPVEDRAMIDRITCRFCRGLRVVTNDRCTGCGAP